MKLTTYDCRKGKYIVAGDLKNGIFSRVVNASHYCRRFKGYGIQEALVQSQNFQQGVKKIEFRRGKKILSISFVEFIKNSNVANLGNGPQRFISEEYLEVR